MLIRRLPKRTALICSLLALTSALMLCHTSYLGNLFFPQTTQFVEARNQRLSQQQQQDNSHSSNKLEPIHSQQSAFESARLSSPKISKQNDRLHKKPNRDNSTQVSRIFPYQIQAYQHPNTRQQTALIRMTPEKPAFNHERDPDKFPPLDSKFVAEGLNSSLKVGNVVPRSTMELPYGWHKYYKTSLLEPTNSLNQEAVDVSASNRIEHNSECALILKRTYIIKSSNEDEWGDKYVFNDVDTEVEKK